MTVNVVEILVALSPAVIVTVAGWTTGDVETVNDANVYPAGIVIDAGTETAGLVDESITVAPFGPAGPLRVTVPKVGSPP